MPLHAAPRNQDQRNQVAWSASEFRQHCAHEQANAAYDAVFAGPLASWQATRAAFYAKKSEYDTVLARRKAADADMDVKARRWMRTVVDANGEPLSLNLRPLLGGKTLLQVLKLAPIRQIESVRKMFIKLAAHVDLQGDNDKLTEFKAATDALADVSSQEHVAERAYKDASAAYKVAEKAFNTAYSKLRKVLQVMLGDDALNRAFPRFNDAETSEDIDDDSSASDASVSGDAISTGDNGDN